MDGTVRVKSLVWFATGVVITLLATVVVLQAWRVDAAPGDSDTTFVPINPGCRFADTRQAGQGPAIGPQQVRTFTAHGTNNACTIPNDAVGLLMNITVDSQTAPNSFLTVWGNGNNPGTSALNPAAGQPPTPNAVTTDLTPAGQFKIYNDAGFVNVIIDINGYYTKNSLTELASRLTATETNIATNTGNIAALETDVAKNAEKIAGNTGYVATLDAREPFSKSSLRAETVETSTAEAVVSVTVTAPAAGQVTVNSTAFVFDPIEGDGARCSITTAATPPAVDEDYLQVWRSAGVNSAIAQVAGTRVFDIAAGEIATYDLVCEHLGISGSSALGNSVLTAIFTPAP